MTASRHGHQRHADPSASPARSVPSALPATSLPRLARPLAILVWLLTVGGPVAMIAIFATLPTPVEDAWAFPAYAGVVATWLAVGAVVVTRRPDSRVGWLIWAVGATVSLSLVGQLWAQLSLLHFGGSLLGTTFGGWLSWLFVPALVVALVVTPLVFPDGRLLSPRWRLVLLLGCVGLVGIAASQILHPGPMEGAEWVVNPTGIEGLAPLAEALGSAGSLLALASLPLCVASAVLRYRRGTLVERQQLKWFGSAMGLAAAGIIGATVLPQPFGQASWIGMTIALGLVPVSIGIAILRYRLFDIDRVIGRTVAYAIVTALLAAAFLGTNLLLQAVLADATGSSTLTTAISTLVIAALFQPVRRRVQRVVDRRFNRARVDGERIVDGFGSHVRDQVDLERLRHAMVAAVDEAVAPSASGVWLRGERPT